MLEQNAAKPLYRQKDKIDLGPCNNEGICYYQDWVNMPLLDHGIISAYVELNNHAILN